MEDPRGGGAYRDELAAAYSRIESLEADARQRSPRAPEPEPDLSQLEAAARRWDRARTTLAMLLGLATLVTLHASERFGASVAVLVATVSMVSVGVTLAWPSLSPRAALVRARQARGTARTVPMGVRVALSDEGAAAPAGERSAALDEARERAPVEPGRGRAR